MSESLLELLEHVDSIKLYVHKDGYTVEAKLSYGLFLDHDGPTLEGTIDDVLRTVEALP